MSARHVPMHITGCDRCSRNNARVVAYSTRMAFRTTSAFANAEAKSELLGIERVQHYELLHHHGKRDRLVRQRRHYNAQHAALGTLVHLEARLTPRAPRVKNAYCAGLGHKWSGPRTDRLEGVAGNKVSVTRICVRGSCHAIQPVAPPTAQSTAERRAL